MVPISFLKLAPGPFPPPLPTKDTVARFVEGFFVLFFEFIFNETDSQFP